MSAVWDAVVAGAGTRPHIDCQKIQGEVYIKEVKSKLRKWHYTCGWFNNFVFGLKVNGRFSV